LRLFKNKTNKQAEKRENSEKLGMSVHVCNLCIQEAEEEEL
jgi:hypothetical protein